MKNFFISLSLLFVSGLLLANNTPNTANFSLTLLSTNPSCPNYNNGSLKAIVNGGIGPFTFVWNNGATTDSIGNLTQGYYHLSVTDALGESDTISTYLYDNYTYANVNVLQNASCVNNSDGKAAFISMPNGIAPYTFLWSNGSTTDTISNLSSGLYSLTVTDVNGCYAITNVFIYQNTPYAYSQVLQYATCPNYNNGKLVLAYTSGLTNPLSYQWSNGSTADTLTNISPGIYYLTVTDNLGCSATTGSYIGAVNPYIYVSTPKQPSCPNFNDGQLTLYQSYGLTAPFSFQWSNGETTDTISNLTAGYYELTITDTLGCSASTNFYLDNQSFSSYISTLQYATCPNYNNGKAYLSYFSSNATPYTFLWSNGETKDTASNLSPGYYYLTVTDANGCSSVSYNYLNNQTPYLSLNTIYNPTCPNYNNGQLALQSYYGLTPPLTFLWSNGETTDTISNLTEGYYYLTVTDVNGCQVNSYSYLYNTSITAQIYTLQYPRCNGSSDGSISVGYVSSNATPYNYLWSNGETTDTISNLKEGYYYVTVTDSNGCSTVTGLFLNSYTSHSAYTTTLQHPSCPNYNDGKAYLSYFSSNATPYTFLWSNGETKDTISNLNEGLYQLTVTDASGCFATAYTYLYNQTLTATISRIDYPSCPNYNDGKIAFTNMSTGATPYSFLWSNGATTDTISNLTEGYYYLTVTDANGCFTTTYLYLSNNPLYVNVQKVQYPRCYGSFDGSATVEYFSSNAPPFTYLWNNGETTQTATNLEAGFVYVTVTDANGCSGQTYLYLYGANNYSASVQNIQNTTCPNFNNGKAALNSFNSNATPYTFLWSNGATTDTISNLSAGYYQLTVTDTTGCKAVSYNWMYDDSPYTEILKIENPSCPNYNNGKIAFQTMHLGTPPFALLWDNGSTADTLSNLSAGIYYLTVTDSKGCTAIDSIWVYNNQLYAGIEVIETPSCPTFNNGKLAFSNFWGGTPPFNFLWSNGETTDTISNLTSGTYLLTITDSKGCTVETGYNLDNQNYYASIYVIQHPSCPTLKNGELQFWGMNSNATPYTFLWSNGETTETASNLNPGYYSLTVTDAKGCSAFAYANLYNYSSYVNTYTIEQPNCTNNYYGSVEAEYFGTSAAKSYLWSNGETTKIATNLPAGLHTVTIADQTGCYATTTFTLYEDFPQIFLYVDQNPSCPNYNNGEIYAWVNYSSNTPYSFLWNNGETTNLASNLSKGNYSVTVTNSLGCTKVATLFLDSNPKPTIDFYYTKQPICPNSVDGSIRTAIYGFRGIPSFIWNTGALDSIYNNITNGSYTLTVTDILGCIATKSITLHSAGNDNVKIIGAAGEHCPNNAVTLAVQNLHNITWSSGDTTSTTNVWSGLQNTSHWVKGTSDKNCSFQDTFSIRTRPIPTPTFNYSINGQTVHFQNKTPYTDSLFWEFGDGSISNNVNNPSHTYNSVNKFTIKLSIKDSCGRFVSKFDTIDFSKFVSLQAKVFLQGAYRQNIGLMGDELRESGLIPLTEPYSTLIGFTHKNGGGGETTTLSVLNKAQSPTVVDWIFLELRNPQLPSDVFATRSALLLQNGDIVDVDGISTLKFFNIAAGNYFISIRHRNHLGFRTSAPIPLSQNAVSLDFSDNSISLFGNAPTVYLSSIIIKGLNAGDAQSDGSIDAFDTIIWETQNGLFDEYQNNADFNLDGSVDALDTILWELNNGKFQELD